MNKKDTSASSLIALFLESHFKEAVDIVEFENEFFAECEVAHCKDEYGKLKRFLTTATRHLRDVDESAFSQTFHKLYQDGFALSDFATKFAMKNTLVSQIYEKSFLNAAAAYEITHSRALEDSFSTMFVKTRNTTANDIAVAVNTKFYLIDRLLWFEASKSEKIKHFFSESSIDGHFDSPTLIKYYLKNTDTGQTQKEDRTQYLREILKIAR